MKIIKLVIAIIVLITTSQVFSQNSKSTIKGVVLTADGKPTEGVTVTLKGTSYSALTNDQGEYNISAVPGNYTLIVSYLGYKKKQTGIILQETPYEVPTIVVEEDTAVLDEVEITGKSKVERAREKAYNITVVDLKKLYNSTSDLNQVLNKTTGVRVRESGGMGSDFNFSLNGFSGDQVKFFLDGIPMDNYGSSLTLNNIPINMAERIEVYKGVVPVELGSDALGGAINIITNKSTKRYVDASYSYGSFNTQRAAINTRFTSKSGFIANLNAFGNYSDNSYGVDVSVADRETNTYLPEQNYKHFHDGYKSATIMAEGGVKDKKFADYLLVGLVVSGNEKEIQQGNTMQRVVGQAFTKSQSFITALKYKKTELFTQKLSLNIAATYNIMNLRVVDTSSRRYDWTGDYVYPLYGTDKGELLELKSNKLYHDKNLQAITNFIYQFNPENSLVFNYSYLGFRRQETEEYRVIDNPGEPSINKNILGLSYNANILSNRLSYSLFGKMYDLHNELVEDDVITTASSTDFGYGAAITYHLTPKVQVKGSYEHAYRLPSPDETLGDGITVLMNPDLKPESSNNFNFGIVYNTRKNKHHFNIESNLIYRNAKDFIRLDAKPNISTYQNEANVRISGIDGLIRYEYSNFLSFEINGTYQETINTDEYSIPGSNIPNYLYGSQLPNVPILYGNADLGFKFQNIKYPEDLLAFNISMGYVGAYYLNWPVYGQKDLKPEIPEQLTENATVSYSLSNGKYNVALECLNITDVKVYDYFRVQKPGRSFSIKLRYFFM